MPVSINELARERRKGLREIKASLRQVDSAVERTERLLNRLINRKTKIPTTLDFTKVSGLAVDINKATQELMRTLARVHPIWTV